MAEQAGNARAVALLDSYVTETDSGWEVEPYEGDGDADPLRDLIAAAQEEMQLLQECLSADDTEGLDATQFSIEGKPIPWIDLFRREVETLERFIRWASSQPAV